MTIAQRKQRTREHTAKSVQERGDRRALARKIKRVREIAPGTLATALDANAGTPWAMPVMAQALRELQDRGRVLIVNGHTGNNPEFVRMLPKWMGV